MAFSITTVLTTEACSHRRGYMAYTEYEIIHSGADNITTLSGDIRLEENRGRLVIYDPVTKRELNVVDRTGYTFSDAADRRIRQGTNPKSGDVGVYVSKPGVDVIDELNS